MFREKETNEKYLRTIEEDQERDMRDLEEKIRNEVNDHENLPKKTSNDFLLFILRNVKSSKWNEMEFNNVHQKKSMI